MRAVRQQVPTPPVEIVEEVVVALTLEEARNLRDALWNVSWSYVNGSYLSSLNRELDAALMHQSVFGVEK